MGFFKFVGTGFEKRKQKVKKRVKVKIVGKLKPHKRKIKFIQETGAETVEISQRIGRGAEKLGKGAMRLQKLARDAEKRSRKFEKRRRKRSRKDDPFGEFF